jgi:L-lactate dehydrogenase complex protein LldF
MLLENRAIAVTENLNGFAENTGWKLWKMAMLNRTMMNMGGQNMKSKVVNSIFKTSWAQHRTGLQFADKSFNAMWKERRK